MQKDSYENHRPEPHGNEEPGGNRYSIEERVNRQPQQNGCSRVVMAHLFVMRLFPKVKMRRNRMLKKMHKKIADQNKHQRLLARQMNGFRNYIEERHGQHVASPQRQKILQILT